MKTLFLDNSSNSAAMMGIISFFDLLPYEIIQEFHKINLVINVDSRVLIIPFVCNGLFWDTI